MRFEYSIAFKYLIPRLKQLSTSIITLLSLFVISLVVWLVVVFLSVTTGLEKKWVDELVSFNAPLKVTPTEAYYSSYYYQIDRLSQNSDYALKTIGEKLSAPLSNPYDPELDSELPHNFPQPDLNSNGELKDIVKESWAAFEKVKSLFPKEVQMQAQEFETAFATLNIHLENSQSENSALLSQVSYITSYNGSNKKISEMILPLREEDAQHLISSITEKKGPATQPLIKKIEHQIPTDTLLGDGVLISKGFQKHGVRVGDEGFLIYYSPTASSMQEQRLPIYVAGFYDPGLLPIGNKILFVDPKVIQQLRPNFSIPDKMLGNGINLWFQPLSQADKVKSTLLQELKNRGLDNYWTVETYSEYEFSKPMLDQLKSDKNLFSLIAVLILLVACSNIISMLILLVNNKQREIAILRALGASRKNIALIFGLSGAMTGFLSSVVGILAAIFTLHNLHSLIDWISFLQGHEAFQSSFYGDRLPNQLSPEVISFVLIATTLLSFLAGLIPAIKAALLKPSQIIRGG